MPMVGLLRFYRVFSGGKVGSARLAFYPLAGFCLNARFEPWLFAADLAVVLPGVLFATALNDYYDYKLEGEGNALGRALERGAKLKTLFAVPLLLPFAALYPLWTLGAPPVSIAALFACLALAVLYCAPPFRWKKKGLLGVLAPPLGLYLTFIQAALLTGPLDEVGAAYAFVVLLFSFYLEFVHLADDASRENEVRRMEFDAAKRRAVAVSAAAVLACAMFTAISLVFAVSAVFWYLRFSAARGLDGASLPEKRSSPFSSIYRIEDFPITLALIMALK